MLILHSVFIEACDSHHNDGYIRETTSHDANTSIHLVVTTHHQLRNDIAYIIVECIMVSLVLLVCKTNNTNFITLITIAVNYNYYKTTYQVNRITDSIETYPSSVRLNAFSSF